MTNLGIWVDISKRLILPIREAPPGNEDVSRFPGSWPGFMTYIAPVAERVAGFSAADLTWVLVIVGVGLVIGKRPDSVCVRD